ncbi:MAG: hypothetical protein PHN49_12395 [Candidatus Omnitrophica bacterium]|nr:hypothetical protein [Candidatus Omnitrophota bacterium]
MSQAVAALKKRPMWMTVMYKGQQLSFDAIVHLDTGDLDQIGDVEYYTRYKGEDVPTTIEAGATWVTNRDLARRTEHATQYECFTRGKYDRMRGGIHASQNYGTRGNNSGAEAQRLFRDEEEVRYTSFQLLTQGASFTNPELWLVGNLGPLLQDYLWKYDIRKVMARQDMERGMKLTDSLGRRNVSAARMALGGAIGNLQLRKKAIRYLDNHVSQEARDAALEIGEIRDAYRRLKYGFQPNRVREWAYQDIGRNIPDDKPRLSILGWPEMIRDPRHWANLQGSLEFTLPIFKRIVALPFRRNATHVVDDLNGAIAAIRKRNRKQLEENMGRLGEGIRWFFALDHLEMQVVTPLSILMYDLEQSFKVDKPKGKRAKFNPSQEMAPREFGQILAQYYRFVGFVDLFKDGILKHPKQDEILVLVNQIAESLEFDDWCAFKEQVLSITDKL